MEHVDGRILRDAERRSPTLDRRRRPALLARSSSTCSLALHAVDYEAVGLGDFGRPDGFLARNVARWGKQWAGEQDPRAARRSTSSPAGSTRALPESGPPTIVHGDYRLDNTMLAPDDPGRIVAVLDWEMSTLGDPLTDLGLLPRLLGRRRRARGRRSGAGDRRPGRRLHLEATRSSTATPSRSGRSIEHLDFYVVFALYKLAVILEGINARFLMGKTLGEGFDEMGARRGRPRATRALEQRQRQSSDPLLRGC